MPASNLCILICATLFGATLAQAQGTFRNLDFELSQVPTSTIPGTFVSVSTAFPLWTVYVGTNAQGSVLYNGFSAGAAVAALLSSDSFPNQVIQGHFTAVLEAGPNGDLAISQISTIPAGTASIFFEASVPNASGWTVTVGGITIPVVEIAPVGNFFLYGGDISAFAGKTEDLRFTALAGTGGPDVMFLDAIQFSSTQVPEPSEIALIALGGLMLACMRFCLRLRHQRSVDFMAMRLRTVVELCLRLEVGWEAGAIDYIRLKRQ